MLIFIKRCCDSFLRTRVLQGPCVQHSVRMNEIGTACAPVPAVRSDRAIFPQPVGRQNVETGVEHRRHELVRVAPRSQSRTKRLNRKRSPLLQIDSTLFIANTKHSHTRICGCYRPSKSADALKESAGLTRNAADQKADSHLPVSR